MTPAVVREDQFSLHVYPERGERHHQPHCHIRRRDGSAETVISLLTLDVLAGPSASAAERAALRDNSKDLNDAWKRQNE